MWQPEQLTTQQKQERRLAAARLLRKGQMSQAQIARHLGVSRQTVSHWAQELEQGGLLALHSRSKTGRKPHLDAQQWQQVLALLQQGAQQGAQAAGFTTQRWTLWRIRWVIWVIEQEFGVSYNTNYLSQKLHQLGWSLGLEPAEAGGVCTRAQ